MTETIQSAAYQTVLNKIDGINMDFTNDSGARLEEGQEVILKTTGKVDKRTTGAQIAIGVVYRAGDNQKKVGVRTYFVQTQRAQAKSSALNAGALVYQNGSLNSTTKYPEVVLATTGNICTMIVYYPGAENAEVRVGILPSAITKA